MSFSVEIQGYDTNRFILVKADTTLPVLVNMNGFNALWHKAFIHSRPLTVGLQKDTAAVQYIPINVLYSMIEQQYGYDKTRLTSNMGGITLSFAERQSRQYDISLDNLHLQFAEGYGLGGDVSVVPKSILVYGTEASLRRITCINVAETKLSDVNSSKTFKLKLAPPLPADKSIRLSQSEVEVYIPVEKYVEKTLQIPITVDGIDSTVRIQLYPSQVAVSIWTSPTTAASIDASKFRLVVDYKQILSGKREIEPRFDYFPASVRIRNINPQHVQSVIIK